KQVTRGSSAGERLAPIGTGVSYIVRNLYILKSLPSLPTLSQRKNTGPFESILIKRAINGKRGIVIDIPINDRKISTDLLIIIVPISLFLTFRANENGFLRIDIIRNSGGLKFTLRYCIAMLF